MRIKFKTFENYCQTPCKIQSGGLVASHYCRKQCKYFCGIDYDKQEVECRYEG